MEPEVLNAPQALETYRPQGVSTPQGETASFAMAAMAKAAIESRYTLAMARPRDWDLVRTKLLKECQRPGFADAAIYHKPIGNGVEGLSIRFVEAAIRCMGNLFPETVAVFDDPEKRIMRVSLTELEANITYCKEVTISKTVERRFLKKGETALKTRINSKGEQIYIMEATDDDILNKANALESKALRGLGLRVIPGDMQDECEQLCYKIRADKAAKDPDAEKKAIYDGFAKLGVTPDMLKEYLGGIAGNLQPKDLVELRGLYSALRDGETTIREILDARKSTKGGDSHQEEGGVDTNPTNLLKDALKGKQAPATTAEVPTGKNPDDRIKRDPENEIPL